MTSPLLLSTSMLTINDKQRSKEWILSDTIPKYQIPEAPLELSVKSKKGSKNGARMLALCKKGSESFTLPMERKDTNTFTCKTQLPSAGNWEVSVLVEEMYK